MKTAEGVSAFTSTAGQERFDTAYRAALARLLPGGTDPIRVTTGYGEAVAYRGGAATGTPVVLLPGAGGNALTWYHYAERLGRRHPVIALDPIGEPGAARQTRPLSTERDVVTCLDETLDGLGLDGAHLVGMSYGGWAALRYDQEFPGRTASLTLLDPGGFGAIGARFWIWLLAGGLAGLSPAPVRRRLAGLVRNATLRDDELMSLFPLTMKFRRRLPVPSPFSDADLAAVSVPTLVLLGERSALYPAAAVARRLRTAMPAARVELVPGASHDLPVHSPELVADRIEAFLV
ncbi:alpha/beta fold hydrolase [Actinoplanes sp. DH11]|uniref:alpha/beta fold hydrolase n=1 Tax=Actinoplanes sp. DH11 TaxID=2857011 RepID=UPI001E4765FF|nr:alpha/beta hydrolase [Actinoplanes sp. DH11]